MFLATSNNSLIYGNESYADITTLPVPPTVVLMDTLSHDSQAKECLKSAIGFSRNELSYVMLGKVYLAEGDVHMAIDIYKRAAESVTLPSISDISSAYWPI